MARIQVKEGQLLEFAKQVELIGTRVLEGFHHSRQGGEGIEFHSALPYSEGEDTRRLDWKRYAATERLYVRKYAKEEKSSWAFVVDASESMQYGEKAQWARLWAASMVFLAECWGDQWQVLPECEFGLEELYQMFSANQGGVSPEKWQEVNVPRDCRLVVLSDFFTETKALKQNIERWQAEAPSLHLVQVLDPREANFDFSGVVQFEDFESSEKLILDSKLAEKTYVSALKKLQRSLESVNDDKSFFQVSVVKQESLENALFNFFERLWPR